MEKKKKEVVLKEVINSFRMIIIPVILVFLFIIFLSSKLNNNSPKTLQQLIVSNTFNSNEENQIDINNPFTNLPENNKEITVADSNKILHKIFLIHAVKPYQAVYELKIDIPESVYNQYKQDINLGRKFDATKNVAQWATINELILKHIAEELRDLHERDSRFQFLDSVFEITKNIKYVSDYSKNESGEYWNYPIETLVEGKGDCEDMAFLTAGILGSIGWDVLLTGLPGHMAMALEMPDYAINAWSQNNPVPYDYYSYNGNKYYYMETTNIEDFGFGKIPDQFKNVIPTFYSVLDTLPVKKELLKRITFGEWKLFSYIKDKFEVLLPAEPDFSVGSYRTTQYNEYGVCNDDNSMCYDISVSNSNSTSIPTVEEQKELAMLQHSDSKNKNTRELLSFKTLSVSGYPASEILVLEDKVGGNSVYFRKRTIRVISLKKIYELVVVYSNDDCQKNNCDQFFDSFKITE